jgi:hypothetical protein
MTESAPGGTFEQTGGTLQQHGAGVVGSYTQSDGTATYDEAFAVHSGGTANLTSAGSLAARNLDLYGTFNQSGGAAAFKSITVSPGGTHRFAGGTLQVGDAAGGTWNLAGTMDFGGTAGVVTVGTSAGSRYIVNLGSGTFQNNAAASVMVHGPDSFIVVAPGQIASFASFAYDPAATVHTTGSTLHVPAGKTVTLTGDFADAVDVQGTLAAGSGSLNLLHSASISGSGQIDLGSGRLQVEGNRTAQVSDTATLRAQRIILGGPSGSGTLLVTGGSVEAVSSLSVGGSGAGTLVQSGGTVRSDLPVCVNSNGLYRLLTGGVLSANVYVDSVGLMVVDGGTHNGTIETWGTYRLQAGTVQGGATVSSPDGMFEQTGGTLQQHGAGVLGSYTQSGGTATYDDAFAVHSGGTVDLTSAASLAARSLDLLGAFNQSGGAAAFKSVTVSPGGSYHFTGGSLQIGTFIGDLVNNGGTLCPGTSPGLTEIQGSFTQLAGALEVELGGLLAGDEYDRLVVTDRMDLGGDLNVVLYGGFQPHAGDVFDIMDWGSVGGTFNDVNLPVMTSGLAWDASDLYRTGELRVVPEPATLALLGLGCLAMVRRRRD